VSLLSNPLPAIVTVAAVGPLVSASVILGTVPSNVAVAASSAGLAVAVTVVGLPAPPLNANPLAAFAKKVHVPLIDPETMAQVLRFSSAESQRVTEVSVDANPEPVAVTVTPLGPDDGLSERVVTVPVNVATAASFAAAPVAVTVLEVPPLLKRNPFPEVGTKVHAPPPDPPVLIEQIVADVGLVTPIEPSVDANPDAVAVTVTPFGADPGLSVRVATVPVKVAVAVSYAGVPVAVTVVGLPAPPLNANPLATFATKVHVPLIDPETTVQVLRFPSVESDRITEVSVDANPEPDAVTVTPLGPDDGLSVRLGITVNVDVAEEAFSSTASTVYAPPGVSGTAKLQPKEPVPSSRNEHTGVASAPK